MIVVFYNFVHSVGVIKFGLVTLHIAAINVALALEVNLTSR